MTRVVRRTNHYVVHPSPKHVRFSRSRIHPYKAYVLLICRNVDAQLSYFIVYVLSFLSLLNSRQHLPSKDVPSHFTAGSEPGFVRSPMADRYTPPLRKQTSSERRIRRIAFRKTTSSFWSPPPPPSAQLDEERGYKDYLPADLSVQQSIGEVEEHCERSLSDESETVRGTLYPTSPTSADSTDCLVIQRPPSIYNIDDVPVVRYVPSLSCSSY